MVSSMRLLLLILLGLLLSVQGMQDEWSRDRSASAFFEDGHSDSTSSSMSSSSESDSEPELVSDTPAPHRYALLCPKGQFAHQSRCRLCSSCGPDFYAREECSQTTNTRCEWCRALHPLRNLNFWLKCSISVKVNEGRVQFTVAAENEEEEESTEFETEGQTKISSSAVAGQKGSLEKGVFTTTILHVPAGVKSEDPMNSHWWKAEFVLEFLLYLAVIALIFAALRMVMKSKPYYRTVTVTAPAFSDEDRMIIRAAAEHLRRERKPGNKCTLAGLEEFV